MDWLMNNPLADMRGPRLLIDFGIAQSDAPRALVPLRLIIRPRGPCSHASKAVLELLRLSPFVERRAMPAGSS